MIPQLPYAPDMAPCDFFFFPRMKKKTMKGCFVTVEEIKTKIADQAQGYTKKCIRQMF